MARAADLRERRLHVAARISCALITAVFAFLLPGAASAQTWSGLGPDNNWSTGANWVGGVAPASSPTTVVVFPCCPSRGLQPFVDAPWTINSIQLSSDYNIGGQALTFAGATPQVTG